MEVKKDAKRSSEVSENIYQATQGHVQKSCSLKRYRSDNLNSRLYETSQNYFQK